MTSFSVRRVPGWCLWVALLLSTVYESYRYPLQLSSEGTSPTYKATPVTIQGAKFVLMLTFCLIALPFLLKKVLPIKKWFIAGCAVYLSFYSVVKAATVQSGDSNPYIITAFWPLVALILVLAVNGVTIEAVNRYFRFVLFYALASNLIEVILFFSIGRLPALAWPNSIFVRFGGFLDDPNGFCAILFMLMGWVYYSYSGAKRFFLEASLVICVLLTQSLTGIGYLAILAIFFGIRFIRPLQLICIGIVGIVLLYFCSSILDDPISTFMMHKGASISGHTSQVSDLSQRNYFDFSWIFGDISYQGSEAWWMLSVINFGIPWFLLCVSIVGTLVLSIVRAFRHAQTTSSKAVMSAVLMLACFFIVGNINLPFFEIFPINFLFFFFAYLVFFNRIGSEYSGTAGSSIQTVTLSSSEDGTQGFRNASAPNRVLDQFS